MSEPDDLFVYDANDRLVIWCSEGRDKSLENFHLISAAPEMLELLERHLLLGLCYLPSGSRESVAKEFEAVLAKAKGEAQ